MGEVRGTEDEWAGPAVVDAAVQAELVRSPELTVRLRIALAADLAPRVRSAVRGLLGDERTAWEAARNPAVPVSVMHRLTDG